VAQLAERFDRWQKHREEKDEINRAIGDLVLNRTPSEEESEKESKLVQRYNDLYTLMYELQDNFTDEDWEAYEVDQQAIREAERQSWLIENRYGDANPPEGISDWWTR
jgi:hypothetical protein